VYHKIPENYLSEGIKIYEKVLLENLVIQAGASETLQTLKGKGIKVAVATGSQRSEAVKKLKKVNLYQYIDHLICSTDVGSMKPHAGYYSTLLEKTGVKPQHTVVIGDDLKEDLEPAKKLGIPIILFPKIKGHLGMVLYHYLK
jgi:putative hydrolase of the HAD superfamily